MIEVESKRVILPRSAYTRAMPIVESWDRQFAARSAMFAPLRALNAAVDGIDWPAPAQLNALARSSAALSGGGQPLHFASLSGQPAPAAAHYELRIHDEGVVPLREANWHDLFNALVWLAFPQTKAALNRAHACELRGISAMVRNRRRDALTLFDESGVLVLSRSPAMLDLIRTFGWKQVFWQARETLLLTTRFVVFGHALYAKALSPYVGMTGHALLLAVSDDTDLAPAPLMAQADVLAAAAIDARMTQPHDLSPLPVLGVPGWWEANAHAAFYDNIAYFRPGRRAHPRTSGGPR